MYDFPGRKGGTITSRGNYQGYRAFIWDFFWLGEEYADAADHLATVIDSWAIFR